MEELYIAAIESILENHMDGLLTYDEAYGKLQDMGLTAEEATEYLSW